MPAPAATDLRAFGTDALWQGQSRDPDLGVGGRRRIAEEGGDRGPDDLQLVRRVADHIGAHAD
ncbi:MAG: hypothetical protein ACREJ0_17615, partial [Geminicoccaceae bacterium]